MRPWLPDLINLRLISLAWIKGREWVPVGKKKPRGYPWVRGYLWVRGYFAVGGLFLPLAWLGLAYKKHDGCS